MGDLLIEITTVEYWQQMEHMYIALNFLEWKKKYKSNNLQVTKATHHEVLPFLPDADVNCKEERLKMNHVVNWIVNSVMNWKCLLIGEEYLKL